MTKTDGHIALSFESRVGEGIIKCKSYYIYICATTHVYQCSDLSVFYIHVSCIFYWVLEMLIPTLYHSHTETCKPCKNLPAS